MIKIPIAQPKIGYDEIQGVMDVIRSGMLAQGSKVEQFERNFADFIGTKYAVACNSGTAALHMAILANNIGKGDEVITTPFTFIATINMIKAVGGVPVYVDIKNDFNIDEKLIEEAITKKTKAILPVHLFGKPCNMKDIMKVAKKHNLLVIEDCAQACGAEYDKQMVGSIGVCGCFSFYPTKIITTGEGGMVTTNDEEVYRKLKLIRNHGMVDQYKYEGMGYNYRMSDISASIGLVQLNKIKTFLGVRHNIAFLYNMAFNKLFEIPCQDEKSVHIYNNYSFCLKNRDKFILNMKENGIDCRVYYPTTFDESCKNALRVSKEIVSIPIRPNMTSDDINHIVENVTEYLTSEGA